MAQRVESVTIWMGRDSYHYFVPVNKSDRNATKYVRADVVDELTKSLRNMQRALDAALSDDRDFWAPKIAATRAKAEAVLAEAEAF